MTAGIDSQPNSSLKSLRAALEKAERQVVHLDGSNIKAFLESLDEIAQTFVELGADQGALRAEEGRWQGLRNRIEAAPQLLVAAASHAGGLAKLRAQHPPATGPWWHLATVVAQRRAQSLKRTGITIAAVVVVVALAFWGINAFTPGANSPTTVSTQIDELVAAQKLPEAQAAVEKARQTSPNDASLLVWDAVLAEQLGDSGRAKTSLAQAQQNYAGQPAAFWTLVGTDRLQVGNLAGAEEAGKQALTLAPHDANATFLLGSVAEAQGDTVQAADFFSKTIALAGDANPQLSAVAKVRMGYLMQRVEPLPGTQSITPTLKP